MKGNRGLIASIVAFAVYGGILTGVIAFLVAIILLINDDPLSAAISFVAAGSSFGFLANALIRN
ncbi:MAG: hypothetical protein A2Z14_12380 [Chloroflexi bacterium RBG_16_48_8]|nr:MAG: hypothetical protein A2Z14_12380 [Chloroflexi bacterium RBG_16_48_8]